MNDNLYNTQINEIEGEIASLRMVLKKTSDRTRAEELKEEIIQLENQLNEIKSNLRKKDSNNFKNKYKKENNNVSHSEANNNDSLKCTDDFLGPTGPSTYSDEDDREI